LESFPALVVAAAAIIEELDVDVEGQEATESIQVAMNRYRLQRLHITVAVLWSSFTARNIAKDASR